MDPVAQVIEGMTRPVYERLRQALEIGRWPDGRRLDDAQRAHTMQMVIAWELRNLPAEERSGFMADRCASKSDARPDSLIASSAPGHES